MKFTNFNIQQFNELKDKKWMLGNKILYDLCMNYPLHKKDEEIRAKIWLIGRSYAASIERRKIKKHINDDFYDFVTKEFIKFNEEENFDKDLNKIKGLSFDENSLNLILELHNKLTKFFKKLTGLEKRSLASKYLHFHVPIFPIYDSRAKDSLNKIVKGNIFTGGDKEYSNFCNKILFLFNELKKETEKEPTLREIDTYLVKVANEELNKKN